MYFSFNESTESNIPLIDQLYSKTTRIISNIEYKYIIRLILIVNNFLEIISATFASLQFSKYHHFQGILNEIDLFDSKSF